MSPRLVRALALPLLLGACAANGDFGRLKPGLVADDIHGWVGRDAARAVGVPVSQYPLTDEERQLRDLGYPLIEPPFDRARWYAIVNEYGVSHYFGWPEFCARGIQRQADGPALPLGDRALLPTQHRHPQRRRPDSGLLHDRAPSARSRPQARRELPLRVGATPAEVGNANARIAENQLVIGWVQHALVERSEAYCFALQRLVIATPAPMAVEVERSLTLLNTRIAENRLITTGQFAVEPAGCGRRSPPGRSSRRAS